MISVIVPVWNDGACLEVLLERLVAEPGNQEIIVVDGGSRDGTQEVVRRFPGVQLLYSARGRGRQMNAGARAARCDVLLFLHCDTIPPRGALGTLPAVLDNADFGAFRMRFDPPFRSLQLLAWFTRWRRPWTCYGDQGIFVTREFFWSTGGFPEIPLLEDVHWLRRAGRAGRMTRSPEVVTTSARRFEEVGVFRQIGRNIAILIRDLMGQNPSELAVAYRKGPSGAKTVLSETKAAARPVVEARVSAERG